MPSGQQVNKDKFIYRALLQQRLRAGLVFLGVVALFGFLQLMAHYKISPWAGPCGFKQKYGLPCPGCGMTTSAVAFAGGRIFESFHTQPAAAFLCCVLAVSAFLAFIIAVFGVYFSFLSRFFAEVKIKYVILALIIIVAAGWAVTLMRALIIDY
jgi:hypothetical protein